MAVDLRPSALPRRPAISGPPPAPAARPTPKAAIPRDSFDASVKPPSDGSRTPSVADVAKQVEAATQRGVAEGAEQLRRSLAGFGKEPGKQAALIEASLPSIQEFGRVTSLEDGRPDAAIVQGTLASLARASEGLTDYSRDRLATTFASKIPDINLHTKKENGLSRAVKDAIKDGHGATFGVALSDALKKAGRPKASENVGQATTEGIRDAREDFEEASKKTDSLNEELARLTTGFAGSLDMKQVEAGAEAFRARHPEYAELEEKSQKLSAALEGVGNAQGRSDLHEDLGDESNKAYEQLQKLGDTPAGQKALGDALEKEGAGGKSFLTKAKEGVRYAKDATTLAESAATVVAKAAGVRLLSEAKTNPARASQVFDGLRKTHDLFGVSAQDAALLSQNLKDIAAGAPNGIADLQKTLKDTTPLVPGLAPDRAAGQAFRGLGVALSGFSVVTGAIDPKGREKAAVALQTASGALQLGADGTKLAGEVLNQTATTGSLASKVGSGLGKLGSVGGKLAGPVSVVADFVQAGVSFANGDTGKGITSTLTAVGGATLSAATALQAVPVAGQIVGALLVAGGIVGGFIVDAVKGKKAEHADERDAQAFLKGAGIPEEAAKKLDDLTSDRTNIGPFITQVAKTLDVTPAALLQHLTKQDGEHLDAFIHVAHRVDVDKDSGLFKETADSDSLWVGDDGKLNKRGRANSLQVLDPSRAITPSYPDSLKAAAAWIRENGLAPPSAG